MNRILQSVQAPCSRAREFVRDPPLKPLSDIGPVLLDSCVFLAGSLAACTALAKSGTLLLLSFLRLVCSLHLSCKRGIKVMPSTVKDCPCGNELGNNADTYFGRSLGSYVETNRCRHPCKVFLCKAFLVQEHVVDGPDLAL